MQDIQVSPFNCFHHLATQTHEIERCFESVIQIHKWFPWNIFATDTYQTVKSYLDGVKDNEIDRIRWKFQRGWHLPVIL